MQDCTEPKSLVGFCILQLCALLHDLHLREELRHSNPEKWRLLFVFALASDNDNPADL